MEKHRFKIVHSEEEEVYRIYDLTDTAIVGITELYETKDAWDRKERVAKSKRLRKKIGYGNQVVGYGIIIVVDIQNSDLKKLSQDEYLRSVLSQMADCFKTRIINRHPDEFERYLIRQKPKNELDASNVPLEDREEEKNNSRVLYYVGGGIVVIALAVAVSLYFLPLLLAVVGVPELLYGKKVSRRRIRW